MGHAERAHAVLSASGAHRWLKCPGSALLEQQFPDTTSESAKEGTLAHELAELKVRHYMYTVDFGRQKFTGEVRKLKKQELWNDEMMRYTDDYLDYIKKTSLAFKKLPHIAIEKRLDLTAFIPDGFGTADCVLVSGEVLHVIDFKYGKSPSGRVNADHNPQMMLYALGAYEIYKLLYPITEVRMSIVQPRLDDGISEWSCSLDDLLAFGKYVALRAELALSGKGEYSPDPETCKWCRARGQCRVRADENVRLAFMVEKKPPLLSNAEVGNYLIQGQDVAKWLNDLQEFALAECLKGKEVPGWKAVEGRGSREWTDMDAAFKKLQDSGIKKAVLYERKPLTLAKVESVVGKKDFAESVGQYVVKRPGKPSLVKESDNREAITNKISAQDAFDIKEA